MFGMRRRDFVALLGGAALASPVAARAQQPGRMRRVGVLMGVAESDPEGQARIAAFRLGLRIWVGPIVATCASSIGGRRGMPIESRLRGGASGAGTDVLVGNGRRCSQHCGMQPAPSQSFSSWSMIPSARALLRTWLVRAATSPASVFLNIRWWENRWRCSGNSRQTSIAWPSCSIRRPRPTTRSSCVHSRLYRHQVRWRSRQLP